MRRAAMVAVLGLLVALPSRAANAADVGNKGNIGNAGNVSYVGNVGGIAGGRAGEAAGRDHGSMAHRAAGVETASRWSFDRTVLRSDVPVLVEFWASWCLACRQLEEPLNVVAAEMSGRARIVRVNVTWSQSVAERYGIESLPAIVVFKNGEVISKSIGGAGIQDLEDMLSPLVRPVQVASR